MNYFLYFALGVSVTLNAVHFLGASKTPLAGIDAPRVERSERSFPATLRNEVLETMKTNRTLNALAFLSALGLLGAAIPASAQEQVVDPLERMYRSVEASNVKNNAEAGSLSLATLSGTRSTTLSLAEQNAVSNQQAMNQLQTKMVAQTTITGATEGSKAVETVQQSGEGAATARMIALLSAVLNSRVTSPSTTP